MLRIKFAFGKFKVLIAFFVLPIHSICGQQPLSLFDKFQAVEVLEIDLSTDLKLLRDQRNTNEYQPATLTFSLGKKQRETWEIKIRPRGKYRRKVCQFPPLKLNFPKDELKAQGLTKDDEFKLVTHCLDGDPGKEYLLREYLAYKLYEQLSPVHFRVQLCKIRYFDPLSGEKIMAWGILMEDEAALARRFNASICEVCYSVKPEQFQKGNLQQVFLFQYMIGNLDWSLMLLRNVLMLEPKDGAHPVIAPYDFDFSGLVNASYARPNADFGQTSLRQRLFIHPDITDESLRPTISYFKDKRKELEALILNFKLLSSSSRKDMLDYIQSFFESLDAGIQRPAPKNP
jgi:hypothetical protein